MESKDMVNCLHSVADYMSQREESPRCASDLRQIATTLQQLEKELAELRENAIVPKFKIGQKVFRVGRYVDDLDDTETPYEVEENEVFRISEIKYYLTYGVDGAVDESELFATREEAVASLVK
jgi:hypothetical protein